MIDRGLADPLVAPSRKTKAVIAAVRALLADAPGAVDLAALSRAVRDRKPADGAKALGDLDPGDLAATLLAVVVAEGKDAAREIGKADAQTISFDIVNPDAERWASKRAAKLIVEISSSTRASIRTLVATAVREGGPPMKVARVIRGMVGLHSRWARAVFNYRAAQEAAGVSGTTLEGRVARYYKRLLTARSRNIARTEILRAANQGKLQAWQQAREAGLFGGMAPVKRWEAASDACPICAAVDGDEVALDDVFSTSEGSADMPPAHPSCRCTAVLLVPVGVSA